MDNEQNNKKWNLYVLRYNYSGNYYVGTTINVERRMGEHWRRDSKSEKRLPKWSRGNKSKKGFKFYWFYIENNGVKQGEAEHCEWELAELLLKEIKEISNEKLAEEVHVGNWKLVDFKKYDFESEPESVPSLDEKIEEYLKEPRTLDTENGKFQIRCYAIGYIGEYNDSQCNKSWEEVASIQFLNNNK